MNQFYNSNDPLLGEESQEKDNLRPQEDTLFRRPKTSIILYSILLLSLILNLLQVISQPFFVDRIQCGSPYAGLRENELQVEWQQKSIYTDTNLTARDHVWDEINHDIGIVAVPKTWVVEKGLPMGSTFPWNESKALYVINAYHQLHCLKLIYRTFMDYREGRPPHETQHHIIHCLDQIYADIRCTADDTLRVTAPNRFSTTAVGQVRSCRNWDALEQWARDNAGCFRYGNAFLENKKPSQIARLRFCPEGSPELETIREYFGKGKDWKPYEEPRWSWFEDDSE